MKNAVLVDSHCHLDFPDFAAELDAVIDRAESAGVGHMLSICTHVSKFDQVLRVAERYDNIFCTVGTHPHNAETETDVTADQLIDLAGHPKVVGFGETGLDYHYHKSPSDVQQRQFLIHIEASRRSGLPLIIHARNADDDMAKILTEEMGKGAFSGLLHCFSSGEALADTALDLGLYISISGIVTFANAENLRLIVKKVQLDRLLVETDAPYLSPVPHRGKRNEPAFVAHTAKKVAEIKGLDVSHVAAATTENFFTLFGKWRV